MSNLFKTIPFEHQRIAFEMSKDAEYFALLMEMGTGKTKVAIDTVAHLYNSKKIDGVVIVAPKSLCRNWSDNEIPVHLHDSVDRNIVLWSKKKLFFFPDKLNIFIINVEAIATDAGYDALEDFVKMHSNVMIIVDESTTIKNPKAKRTKILHKFSKRVKFRRILTGTLISNTPMDAFAQCNFLKDGILGSSFFAFRSRYALVAKRFINGRSFDEIVGFQRLDELKDNIKKFSYRVLKKDCLDLSEKIYTVRYVEMEPEQKRIYNELRDESLALTAKNEVISAQLAITQLLRMRQALCNIGKTEDGKVIELSKKDNRLQEIFNIIEEAGEQKIIIWTSFVPVVERLVREIGKEFGCTKVAGYYGSVSAADRAEIVERMQEKDSCLKYLVIQYQTGGMGLTITEASISIYHDHDWSLKDRQQSEDRNHRIGQKKNVTYIDLVCRGTCEEKIRDALVGKSKLAAQVNGDFLKEVLS